MRFPRDFSPPLGVILTAVCAFGWLLILTFTARATDPNARMDFDGDGKTDIAVFRAGQRGVFPFPASYFYILGSRNNQLITSQWGRAYDIHTPADYDGDGRTDVGIFRWLAADLTPSLNHFWIDYTTGGHTAIPFSGFGNIVSRNYFGGAAAEIAVFDRYDISEDPTQPCFIWALFVKPAGSDFALRKDLISECLSDQQYLTPAIADYNGDGISDPAMFTQTRGAPSAQSQFKLWFSPVSPQYTAPVFTMNFDIDTPIPGDYDGDNLADIAGSKNVGGTRLWRIRQSTNGAVVEKYFGFSTDYPVPGDYDGDNKTDIAVYRPGNGSWYITRSSDGALISVAFGLPTDVPLTVPNSNIYY